MASQIVRYTIPIGATFIYHGTVYADSVNRPSSAAVYAEPPTRECCDPKPTCKNENRDPSDTELERLVMKGRQELGPYYDVVVRQGNNGIELVKLYHEKLLDNIAYLRTRAPQELRIGTIVATGLTGMLMGIRGGLFKKLFMGTLGSGAGAYLAYLHETEKYTKKYSAVAYNFVAGTRK